MNNTLKTGDISGNETILCQPYKGGATTMIRRINDEKELHKLVAYLIMGDGGVYRYKETNARFILIQREDHLDFIEYAQAILLNITGSKYKYVDRSKDTDANRGNQYRLVTSMHPIFTKMRNDIYTDRYKGLSPHYLKLLDWEALSILYMSDGCYSSNSLTLNLKRLSYGDQILLKRALEERGMGVWNINRQNNYYYLRLRNKFIDLVMSNLSPYIAPSYQYKLIPEYRMSVPTDLVGDDIV
jgi:hypothetical protein